MKKNKKNKLTHIRTIAAYGITAALIVEAGVFGWLQLHSDAKAEAPITQTVAVKAVDSQISADGTVTAQDQATLHFQTGGKLVLLPLKEGDKVYQGQTIAQLDTYALQRQLNQALNTYKIAQNTNQQSQADQQTHVTQDTQASKLKGIGAEVGAGSYGTTNSQTSYIDDTIKRIADSTQAAVDSSTAAVELANYAIQLSTLTSPLNGIVTHEDVNVSGVNVTPTTSFTVADPTTLVFRAMIPDYEIDYVSEGADATITLDGNKSQIHGTVAKIYPSKITLSSGEQAYQVDIQTSSTKDLGKLDQTGSVMISSNAKQDTMLIPAWTVIGSKYVWVSENDKPVLKSIKTGKVHGTDIEILGGLNASDKVIVDPKSIPEKEYPLL